MWVFPNDGRSPGDVRYCLDKAIAASRFTAKLENNCLGRKEGVKIECVRLRNRKPYCGAHPGPCVALFPRKHMNATYLEGLDWVGFNHLLNDVLDKLSWSATIFSFNRESDTPRYYIRRGRLRRVGYSYAYRGNFAHWTQGDFETDFADHCGKPSPPYPLALVDYSGTPGYACYSLEDEARLRKEEAELLS